MNAQKNQKPDADTVAEEDAPRWPAVVGVILIILFTWGGIEVFVLQGQPIATLEHGALTSDEGAAFDVESADQDHMVQVWSYVPDGEDRNPKKTDATLSFSVVAPGGEVVVEHEDVEARAEARYVKFAPKEAGEYRIRVLTIDGAKDPKAQAVVLTGNNQVLLPLIGRLLD
ncbi:MAG: hypothetical protein ACQEVA_02525 [Myxococcota bacterium]